MNYQDEALKKRRRDSLMDSVSSTSTFPTRGRVLQGLAVLYQGSEPLPPRKGIEYQSAAGKTRPQLTSELIKQWTQEWLEGKTSYQNLNSYLTTRSRGHLPLKDDC